MIYTLSDNEARGLLQSASVAWLGCIVDDAPYIVPINYIFEDNCVYSHSLPGMKIRALRENPRACVQAGMIESPLRWSSVLAFGKFEEILEAGERHEIMGKLRKRFPLLTPVESAIFEDGSTPEIIVYRIRIDRLTGVSEGKPTELECIEHSGFSEASGSTAPSEAWLRRIAGR